ncbi:serine/threonine protein phosphatase 2A 55 kDa regulatory subunit B beta isoform-like isoform X2 [Curcuma longa]|uniref:serine/threonine protein phosphatase 2A 55 kDa regulatory subunit B beta isoform-like isoform X2 n=1 Tax=Curcuma longa TaxID=136217 RepID=UPI003D9E192F
MLWPYSNEATNVEASKNPMRLQVQNSKPAISLSSLRHVVRQGAESPSVANGNSYDFISKILYLAWHPTENSIICAAMRQLVPVLCTKIYWK